MSTFDTLGDIEAKVELVLARQLGVQALFTHRENTEIDLWVRIKERDNGLTREGGIDAEERMVRLIVATGQPGFTPASGEIEPVTAGDTFTYQSRVFHVLNPIASNRYGTVYTLRCVERKALDVGVGGPNLKNKS